MTTATLATDNATTSQLMTTAQQVQADARRITERDPDFQRLHAQTVRRLTASLRAYVRALRTTPASDHPHIATAFIHRQVDILRTAYAAAHREGVRDYYGAFSRTPGRWLHTPLAPQQPAPHVVVRRLGFYAPSVAKMAHEALQALTREQAAATATLSDVQHQPAHTGVMVAFMLAPQAADKLAIAGGEPPEDLHITLAFLGEKADLTAAQIKTLRLAVSWYAAEAAPLRGRITGVGRFPGQPDNDMYPCLAEVDIPGIQRWRAGLVERLKAAGLPVDMTFTDYHPHITLAYVPKGEPLPVKDVPHLPLVLGELTLAMGDERHTWRIGDEQYPDAAPATLAENVTKTVTLSGHQPGYSQNREANGQWGPGGGHVAGGGTESTTSAAIRVARNEHMSLHGDEAYVVRHTFTPNEDIQRNWSAWKGSSATTRRGAIENAVERDENEFDLEPVWNKWQSAHVPVGQHKQWDRDTGEEAPDAFWEHVAGERGYDIRYNEGAKKWVEVDHQGLACFRLDARHIDQAIDEGKGWTEGKPRWEGDATVGKVAYLGDLGHGWHLFWTEKAITEHEARHSLGFSERRKIRMRGYTITLAGDPPANTGDFLDGIASRVNLQAEITWSGFNDGYVDAGGSDPANPYNLIAWVMNPPSKHCGECPVYEANSPYDPPWVQGGNQLNATPGDGHTECGAGCKCSLEYVSAAAAGAAGGPDPRGTIWDSPNGPTPPPGPDGQPGKWPNIAGVADMSTLAPEQQQALQDALDAYRRAFERWESIRGTLPSLPDMFGVAGGEGAITGGVWPEWESLSPSQQKALGEVYQALSDFNAASGAPTMEEVQAGLAASQQQMEDILAQSQDMRDQLADMVAAAQAEQQQTQQELFGGGPLRNLLRQILMGLDDWIDLQKDTWYQLFHGGNGDNGGGDQQFADAADAAAIRLYNPNHVPAGSRQGGQFAPRGGGGIGGGDEEMARISRGGGTGGHPLVHARGAGGGGGGGGHQREAITAEKSRDPVEVRHLKLLLDSTSSFEDRYTTRHTVARQLAERLRDNPAYQALADHILGSSTAQITSGEGGMTRGERAADIMLHAWEMSSQHPISLALQDATAREFGLSVSHHTSVMTPGVGALEDHEAGLRAFARAVYDNTQEWFARNGITSVVLSRGMGWDSGREPSGIHNWHQTGETMPFHLHAVSSFSVDPTIAHDTFASYQDYRAVIHGRVPVSRIWSTGQSGPGTKYESEMLVLGDPTIADSFSVDTYSNVS